MVRIKACMTDYTTQLAPTSRDCFLKPQKELVVFEKPSKPNARPMRSSKTTKGSVSVKLRSQEIR
jgi:hypothetical protein